jgi:FkbM family methyltransferase
LIKKTSRPVGLEDVTSDWPAAKAVRARDLCAEFIAAPESKRFVFGRNVYSEAVTSQLPMAGIVDDFTELTESNGVPIIRLKDLPADSFVLVASGGRPLTVRRLLAERNIRQIDYFTFLRWSGRDLPEAVFNEGFSEIFSRNRADVAWLYDLLVDELSRKTLVKLLGFRCSYDMDWLDSFTERQTEQYFEDFLDLNRGDPIFLDVGGFDGFTAEEFIRRTPGYRAVYVLEPEPVNLAACSSRLANQGNVIILPYGASDKNTTLRFSSNASASRFCDDGEIELEVRRIDDVITGVPTFIKMDIEGGELSAIKGAAQTISDHRPTMAICVYHRPGDFWDVPRTVLSIAPSYRVYLRHYTECIYETVMYFVPEDKA